MHTLFPSGVWVEFGERKLSLEAVVTSLQEGLQWPLLLVSRSYGVPANIVPEVWSVWPTEYRKSDSLSLLRLGYKRHCSFFLGLSVSVFLSDHLLWGKLAAVSGGALCKDPCSKELRSPGNSQHQLVSLVCEPPWKQILQPQSSLQMMVAPTDTLTKTLWETLSQTTELSQSLALWDNECLLF